MASFENVSGTPELLENILEQVPLQFLPHISLVCKAWHISVHRNTKLRRRLDLIVSPKRSHEQIPDPETGILRPLRNNETLLHPLIDPYLRQVSYDRFQAAASASIALDYFQRNAFVCQPYASSIAVVCLSPWGTKHLRDALNVEELGKGRGVRPGQLVEALKSMKPALGEKVSILVTQPGRYGV